MLLTALNRKLLRDLGNMRGQALAIAFIAATGVVTYVALLSVYESLRLTQQSYYETHNFGDVFGTLVRAPRSLEPSIAGIPGVATVETRVVAAVTLDVPGFDDVVMGRLISVPANRRPRVNDIFLRSGRWIDPNRPNEVIASENFVAAHGLALGGQISAVMNGHLRSLTIVGVALSPEYVYTTPPGELMPDDKRFGIFWMERRTLAATFDLENSFNDLALILDPATAPAAVLARVDQLLEPYGGTGSIPRELQRSHWLLESELDGLQAVGAVLPILFLLVSAFILHMALVRALALQRPQIAALKALGYNNQALGWHYLKWALLIGLGGVVVGMLAGVSLGSPMIEMYNVYFHFPVLLYQLSSTVAVSATILTLGAAALGATVAVRRAVRVPPAEGMRPEPPARYKTSIFEMAWLPGGPGPAGRMVLRNIVRHPVRAIASVAGIGFAVALLMTGLAMYGSFEELLVTQFSSAERQDVSLTFVEPRSEKAHYALKALPGVIAVEAQRSVAVRIRAGHRQRTLPLTGIPDTPRLRLLVDRHGQEISPPQSGLILSKHLGETLQVEPGDVVTIEVLEGNRSSRTLTISGLVDDLLGLSAYMNNNALHRMMHESAVLTGADLLVDSAYTQTLSQTLKYLPAVAGVAFKEAARDAFRDVIAASMIQTMGIIVLAAAIVAFGVVYNAARVALSERSRELASLRVIGFTRAEISFILLSELALLTVAALPVGTALGWGLIQSIAGFADTEVYRMPVVFSWPPVAWACLTVIVASACSGLVVRRRLDRLDLVEVLKISQ
jgi:putative ABC transport system permease protein